MDIKDAIELLTGDRPDKVEKNCGTTSFKKDGIWYFITINECEPEDIEDNKQYNNNEEIMYEIFNETDGIYATNESFYSIKDAKKFINKLRKMHKNLQGYYLTSNQERIDPDDVVSPIVTTFGDTLGIIFLFVLVGAVIL